MTAEIRTQAYQMIEKRIQEEETRFGELSAMIKPLFGDNITAPSDALVYDILWSLEKQGRLVLNLYESKGVCEGIPAAPLYYMSIQ